MTDYLYKSEIQQMVRTVYGALDLDALPARSVRPYADDVLASLPEAAARWAFGTGDPVTAAAVQPGERVVDLGCGAGADVVLAARAVGPTGRVLGVDLLPQMCARTAASAVGAGVAARTAVVNAEIEALPLRSASMDLVVSNGVLSLSIRKARVLAEAHRVLRPGGRVVLADMTLDEENLPNEVLLHPSAWAG